MFEVLYQRQNGERHRFKASAPVCTIGSGRGNDLVLKSRQVAKVHAEIVMDDDGIRIADKGSMTGTWVNRERVVTYGPIHPADEIIIGDWRLWINGARKNTARPSPRPAVPAAPSPEAPAAGPGLPVPVPEQDDESLYWRQYLHDKLIEQMDLRRKDVHSMSDDQLRRETEALLEEILADHDDEIPSGIDRAQLHADVLNEAVGLGPLERLLADDSITEVMVNRANQIFVERNGRLELSDCTFTSDHAVLSVIERIISPLGRRIDESSPMVDARLKDGSRVNAIIPPLAIKGPSLTIRKFAKKRLRFEDLIRFGSLDEPMVEFLRVCVEQRKNIIVSGGTGSGKTTLLNVLSNFIPMNERIVTVEDAAELQLNQPNLVSLESRPPNLEGKGAITIRDLVRNALRMRPDRIVVGECRGGEALDMLQAMNTGHDGSLTTAHANSPRDVLSRIEVMVMMAGMELPVSAIREQIASAVDIIVQQARFPCGSRKVTHITEVAGIESGTIQLQNIFVFNQTGVDENGKVAGRFEPCGFVPSFYEELARIGLDLDLSIFGQPRSFQ